MIYTEAPQYGGPISAVIDMVFRLTSSISFYEPTEKKIVPGFSENIILTIILHEGCQI